MYTRTCFQFSMLKSVFIHDSNSRSGSGSMSIIARGFQHCWNRQCRRKPRQNLLPKILSIPFLLHLQFITLYHLLNSNLYLLRNCRFFFVSSFLFLSPFQSDSSLRVSCSMVVANRGLDVMKMLVSFLFAVQLENVCWTFLSHGFFILLLSPSYFSLVLFFIFAMLHHRLCHFSRFRNVHQLLLRACFT